MTVEKWCTFWKYIKSLILKEYFKSDVFDESALQQ